MSHSDDPSVDSGSIFDFSNDHAFSEEDGALSDQADDDGSLFERGMHDGPSFQSDRVGTWLAEADEDALDRAPFGIIEVDADGVVLFYNETEADFANVDADVVTGQNFFTEVAPCTNNRVFRGRFQTLVQDDTFDEQFTYTMTYRMAPTLVDVRLLGTDAGRWVLISPRMAVFDGFPEQHDDA